MASVHRAKGRKVWVAYFRDCNKKLIGRSTGVTNKAAAKVIAAKYEETARKAKSLRAITRTLTEMYQLVGGIGQPKLVTTGDYIQRWLEDRTPEISVSSRKFYLSSTAKFLQFLGTRAECPLLEITKDDVINYRKWLLAKVSPARTNALLATVRMILGDAVKGDALADNVAEHVGAVAKEKHKGDKRRAFTLPELQAVMAVANPEWQSMIRFGLFTGQRLSDLAHLRWSNLDLVKNVIRLTTGKTGRTMIIPISEVLRGHIAALPVTDNPAAYLHPWAASQKNQAALSARFGQLLTDAGLRSEVEQPAPRQGDRRKINGLSFHSLRHTAVSLLKDAGVPQAVVQELIGHESAEISAKYTHVGEAALQKAANALPKI
jgi:integrase